MGKYRRNSRARQSARTGAMEIFVRPHRSLPGRIAGTLVRCRVEIAVGLIVLVAYQLVTGLLPGWPGLIALAAAAAALYAVPPARRYITRRHWCVLTRHRVRSCFTETRTMTHSGKTPYLLWSRPTPVGERVQAWLPAGLSVKDVMGEADRLASACWARACRIEPSERFASLVAIHIVRRDPLRTGDPLAPEVLDRVEEPDQSEEGGPLPTREEVLASVTPLPSQTVDSRAQLAQPIETARPARTARRTATTNSHAPSSTQTGSDPTAGDDDPEPEVMGYGGVDVSDIV